jgi:uncharacterized membrane protein YqjE
MSAENPRPSGLLHSLRAVLAQALALLVTRGELAAVELAEARDRTLRWLVLGLTAAVLLLAALMTLSLWVAAVFWDGPRALALGVLALAYAAIGATLIGIVRREAAAAPPVLAQTFAELQKDRAVLRGGSERIDDATG